MAVPALLAGGLVEVATEVLRRCTAARSSSACVSAETLIAYVFSTLYHALALPTPHGSPGAWLSADVRLPLADAACAALATHPRHPLVQSAGCQLIEVLLTGIEHRQALVLRFLPAVAALAGAVISPLGSPRGAFQTRSDALRALLKIVETDSQGLAEARTVSGLPEAAVAFLREINSWRSQCRPEAVAGTADIIADMATDDACSFIGALAGGDPADDSTTSRLGAAGAIQAITAELLWHTNRGGGRKLCPGAAFALTQLCAQSPENRERAKAAGTRAALSAAAAAFSADELVLEKTSEALRALDQARCTVSHLARCFLLLSRVMRTIVPCTGMRCCSVERR